MLGRLSGARERIEAVLARSGNTPAALSIAGGALDTIAHMEGLAASGRIGPSDLASLANILTAAQSAVTALEAAWAATAARATEQLAAASAEARATVRSVMAGMRDFDGELRFASSDDARAYRDREAARRAYIEAQPATPEGNLNAAGAAIGQMADAKAHGAHGPEFDKRWEELAATTERLRKAAQANGVPTEEFDRRLREDLRRILESKGVSDTQIDARFAAAPDPLEAAKAFVKGDTDLAQLDRSAQRIQEMSKAESIASQDAVKSAITSLQTAGVTTGAHAVVNQPDHGVAISPGAGGIRSI